MDDGRRARPRPPATASRSPSRWRSTGQAGLRYLAVPVGRDAGGRLAVTDYPAAVGPPALADELPGDGGDDVADTQLTAVVRRALGNYVAGAGDNLRADLAPGAQLRSPTPRMTLDDVVSIQWAGPQRVSAVIVARDRADVAYTLRYELAVVRRDRWYVAEINPPMTPKGVTLMFLPSRRHTAGSAPARRRAPAPTTALLMLSALVLVLLICAGGDAYAAKGDIGERRRERRQGPLEVGGRAVRRRHRHHGHLLRRQPQDRPGARVRARWRCSSAGSCSRPT